MRCRSLHERQDKEEAQSLYDFSYSDNFIFQALCIHRVISSEILCIDYTVFQNTFSSKVFLNYLRILKEEQIQQAGIL